MAGLIDRTVSGFAEEVASESPAPGGGSSAALAGGIAAGLVAMVCRLSLGKQGLAATGEELSAALEEMETLRPRLLELVDEDTAAFDRVMDAIRLPKETDDERAARRTALDQATLFAAEVPLQTLEACRRVAEVAGSLAGRSNPAAASDLGVALELARAGAEGALLNIAINVSSLAVGGAADDLRATGENEIAVVRRIVQDASQTIRDDVGAP